MKRKIKCLHCSKLQNAEEHIQNEGYVILSAICQKCHIKYDLHIELWNPHQ